MDVAVSAAPRPLQRRLGDDVNRDWIKEGIAAQRWVWVWRGSPLTGVDISDIRLLEPAVELKHLLVGSLGQGLCLLRRLLELLLADHLVVRERVGGGCSRATEIFVGYPYCFQVGFRSARFFFRPQIFDIRWMEKSQPNKKIASHKPSFGPYSSLLIGKSNGRATVQWAQI